MNENLKMLKLLLELLSTIDPQWLIICAHFQLLQDNVVKRLQLELEIANYKQGNLFVPEYYYGVLKLVDVPKALLAAVQEVYNTRRRDQFLKKLRLEFEVVRGALLKRNHVPSLDTCVNELLRKEQHLLTHGIMSLATTANNIVILWKWVYVSWFWGEFEFEFLWQFQASVKKKNYDYATFLQSFHINVTMYWSLSLWWEKPHMIAWDQFLKWKWIEYIIQRAYILTYYSSNTLTYIWPV